MSAFRRFWFFLTRWRRVRDLDEEMRFHVEMRAATNRDRGLTPDRASHEASRRFGNLLKVREESRDAWGFVALERLGADAWYAARYVLRRPAWTSVIVCTLALGVGANTSIFALIDTMMLRPAAWNADGRLVWITSLNGHGGMTETFSYPDYLAYRSHATTMSAMLAFSGNAVALGGGAATERVNCGLVSGNYFNLLGLRAEMGRTFVAADDGAPGGHPVAVLSDALWRTHFGADPAIVGKIFTLNGKAFTTIGVAPRGFGGVEYAANPEQLWVPFAMTGVVIPRNRPLLTDTNAQWVQVIGCLAAGQSAASADAEVRVIARRLNPPGTPPDREERARVVPMRGGLDPGEQQSLEPIFALLAIVPGIVLLVACANVANVLMARNVGRRRELAVRRAIGASRGRLIRLLLLESVALAFLATCAGFAVSFGLTTLVAHYGEVGADFGALIAPGARALTATAAVALVATLLSGLWPALTATEFSVLPMLKEEGPTSTGGRTRIRRAFLIVQVALSLMLVIVAGLFVRSLSNTTKVDPGFDSHGLATVSFDTSMLGYSATHQNAFMTAFVDRAAAIPGVTSVAVTDILPIDGDLRTVALVKEGDGTRILAAIARVSPRYFDTMRLPIIRGREFTAADAFGTTPVAIVNQTLAKRLWPNADALGKRIRVRDNKEPWRFVVGVASDAKYQFLNEPAQAACYLPIRTDATTAASIIVRAGDPRAAISSLTEISHALDPNLPLFNSQTIDAQIRHSEVRQRAVASMLSILGMLTLLLAAVGLYGVAAQSVSLRTREIGIRMSLGARAADVFRMVIGENFSLCLTGIVLGLGLSAAASRLVTSFLFGLTGTDPTTFAVRAATLCVVAVIASYLPARWAARVDPLVALRHD